MLYIDFLDGAIRFGNAVGGGAYAKYYSPSLTARADEYGRIWIDQIEVDTGLLVTSSVLNSTPVDEITLNGVIYDAAINFVTIFNYAVPTTSSSIAAPIMQIVATDGQQVFSNLSGNVSSTYSLIFYNGTLLYSGYTFNGATEIDLGFPCNAGDIITILPQGQASADGVRTIILTEANIDLNAGEDFEFTCGTDQQFTITVPVIKKPFRMVLTGGTLNTTLFAGYTETWVGGSLKTDYDAGSDNWLYCEIRAIDEIYLFLES